MKLNVRKIVLLALVLTIGMCAVNPLFAATSTSVPTYVGTIDTGASGLRHAYGVRLQVTPVDAATEAALGVLDVARPKLGEIAVELFQTDSKLRSGAVTAALTGTFPMPPHGVGVLEEDCSSQLRITVGIPALTMEEDHPSIELSPFIKTRVKGEFTCRQPFFHLEQVEVLGDTIPMPWYLGQTQGFVLLEREGVTCTTRQ